METVYVETTIIGHLVGRVQINSLVAARQHLIRQWWPHANREYRLVISPLVAEECAAGDTDAASERLESIQALEVLEAVPSVLDLSIQLIEQGAVPPTEPRDAFHIAIAAVHGVDYLLTWNFKHIANATRRLQIEETCRSFGVQSPVICSPEELIGETSNDIVSD